MTLALLLFLTLCSCVLAADSGRLFSAVAGGGATFSSSSQFELSATIGQATTGVLHNEGFAIEAGFWNGLVANRPPRATSDAFERTANQSAKIPLAKLLANDFDPDSGPLTLKALDATSTHGGTVRLDNGWVLYQPPSGFNGADTFTYTVIDVLGESAVNTVTVLIAENDNNPTRNIVSMSLRPNGSKMIRFIGIAGMTFSIQVTSDLARPQWREVARRTASSSGTFEFEDDESPAPLQRFYRAVAN